MLSSHNVLLLVYLQTEMKAVNDQEENELVILHLRQLCGQAEDTCSYRGRPIGEMFAPD